VRCAFWCATEEEGAKTRQCEPTTSLFATPENNSATISLIHYPFLTNTCTSRHNTDTNKHTQTWPSTILHSSPYQNPNLSTPKTCSHSFRCTSRSYATDRSFYVNQQGSRYIMSRQSYETKHLALILRI
jgi:hypothetical protein